MPPDDQAGIATHLVLPAWWVRAYEAAMQREGGSVSAMEHACAAQLAPALSPVELNSLAIVIANLQMQVLSGASRTLNIDLSEHLKHAGSFARSRLFAFERIIQQLPGVRILAAAEQIKGVQGQGSLRAFPLFSADRWLRHGEGPDDFTIELTMSALGADQLLGFADAHQDLLRFARAEPEASEVLGGEPPLSLWRSIWLELQGVEQLLFMRLERSMQWDFQWLQLDGVFGLPMARLFSGIVLPEARFGDDDTTLARRLKVLARLGRKLSSHGFLGPQTAGQYLALSPTDEDLTLVWQMSRERLLTDAMHRFRTAYAQYKANSMTVDDVEALAWLCMPDASHDAMEHAYKLWALLVEQRVSVSASSLVGLHFEQSRTLQPQTLFFELCLRRQITGRFPIPEPLLSGPVGEMTHSTALDGVLERFHQFISFLEESPDFVRILRDVPLASLASPISREVSGFAAFARSTLAYTLSVQGEALDATRPRLVQEGDMNVPASRPLAKNLSSSPSSTGVAPSNNPAFIESAQPGRSLSGAATLSGALASRMRKTAADELQRIEVGDPDRYRDLKKAYFDSLDAAGRRLILDVQKRMQPVMFDDHLRQRLVRFMVENPGAWRSAEMRADGPRASDLR